MRLKKIILKFVKHLPTSNVKVMLLKTFKGYNIGKNVTIGKAYFNCETLNIGDNVKIANGNNFTCNTLIIGDNTVFHSNNNIVGSGVFKIGNNSRVINNHYFDVWNNITIGNDSWIAGKNSEFWTHGSIHTKTGKNLDIEIGDNNYIGSSCKFAPGVKIGSINIVGLGSVVTNSFNTNNNIIAGNPAKIVKNNIDWRVNW
ncbi:transferase family hexapeptide repeat protein [Lacinutrix venerupis]|uniref:acyltransferase n=1 Tax=Lacinutrix venerupis TaxID=1486034 RepID=UPI000EADFB74|nr:hypothetical protein [Lacinutrix venerupis]RLJ64375.1 transferase family hexapeptide repeat protein [Lacinutrix venerupis]